VPGYEAYRVEDLIEDLTESGHTFVATVCVDSHANWRDEGPRHLRPVGETEFVERIAERCSQAGGKAAGACRGIVPHADLTLGHRVEEVLLAHRAASPKRFCGIRQMTISDPDYKGSAGARPHTLESKDFREGFGYLARYGLSFDTWLLHPQLPELTDLAREFPETTIILDHIGGPIGVGRYAGRRQEGFHEWRSSLALLAQCQNVFIKVGGLHNPMMGLTRDTSSPPRTSLEMAQAHREHILVAIDLFGSSRCMFESDFPVSRMWTSSTVLWNAFKRVTADFSANDKDAMFRGVATRVYKLS
jgi:predicted TIM-barrel fold metal-dependent hydrolase